jgi:hypothetical protein
MSIEISEFADAYSDDLIYLKEGSESRGQIRSWLFTVDSEKSRFRKSEFLFGSAANNPE